MTHNAALPSLVAGSECINPPGRVRSCRRFGPNPLYAKLNGLR